MTSLISKRERMWAFIVHAPIITIIWASYLFFVAITVNEPIFDVISKKMGSLQTLPITPLLFTFLTIPISLSVRQMQRRSSFVKAHASQAYAFNISLLYWYAGCLSTVIMGKYIPSSALIKAGFFILSFASVNCLVQAMLGMRAALMGKPYRYHFVTMYFARHFSR